mmetsp:Transcript_41496/g.82090  ORF Transcript_41496/g.82090 Transcript_41496/m.82090 type:complete len:225 (+) Transcript_41496:121-795(+)
MASFSAPALSTCTRARFSQEMRNSSIRCVISLFASAMFNSHSARKSTSLCVLSCFSASSRSRSVLHSSVSFAKAALSSASCCSKSKRIWAISFSMFVLSACCLCASSFAKATSRSAAAQSLCHSSSLRRVLSSSRACNTLATSSCDSARLAMRSRRTATVSAAASELGAWQCGSVESQKRSSSMSFSSVGGQHSSGKGTSCTPACKPRRRPKTWPRLGMASGAQ